MIKDTVSEAIQIMENIHKQEIERCKQLEPKVEESFYFNGQNKHLVKKYNFILSSLKLQKLILDELKEITVFEHDTTGLLHDSMSPYGSLYYCDGVLHYNDTLMSYNAKQMLEILCNHILHCYSFSIRTITKDKIYRELILKLNKLGLSQYCLNENCYEHHLLNSCDIDMFSKFAKDIIYFMPSIDFNTKYLDHQLETQNKFIFVPMNECTYVMGQAIYNTYVNCCLRTFLYKMITVDNKNFYNVVCDVIYPFNLTNEILLKIYNEEFKDKQLGECENGKNQTINYKWN